MRWLRKICAHFGCKRFVTKNYPVRYEILGGMEWVLMRNLSTHQYGGVWVYAKSAVEQWGENLVNFLKVEYAEGIKKCQRRRLMVTH